VDFSKCPYCDKYLRKGGFEVKSSKIINTISAQWVEKPKRNWLWGPTFERRKPLYSSFYSTVRIALFCEECNIVMINPRNPKDIAKQLSDEAEVWQFHFPNPGT
jgi:hypothetical protein